MLRRLTIIAAFVSAAAFAVASAMQSPPAAVGATPLLLNERHPLADVLTGGATGKPEEFEALAAAGYRTFVDLRSESEVPADTRDRVVAAGLEYVWIPVTGEAELDLPTVRALDAVLDDAARLPAVVACASGNRSGALLALRSRWLDVMPAEAALALGESAGLTRLEPSIRVLLGLPPEAPPEPEPKNEVAPVSPKREGNG